MRSLTTTLTFLFLALGTITFAQPGSLDGTFGVGGKVTNDFGMGDDQGMSVAIQSDGKIVVAGSASNGADRDFALVRYNTDGMLDNSFGTDGKVTTDIGTSSSDRGYSVAIQSDGKIVVAGQSVSLPNYDFYFALARYNVDGSLDNSFSSDGKVTTDFGTYEEGGKSVAIQSDGKIVVAGWAQNGSWPKFALTRYNVNGSVDYSFNTNGKVITDFSGGNPGSAGNSVAIQPDGKIVVAGISSQEFALARYNSDGSLDNSFSTDGKVTTDFGPNSSVSANSVTIQPDGRIVVAGYWYSLGSPYDYEFALARYNIDGMLDNSFGIDGLVTTDFGSNAYQGRSVAIQSDGKIVVAGWSSGNGARGFALTQYNTDGTVDNSFGINGIVTTNFGTDYYVGGESVAIQPDAKIVVTGTSDIVTDLDFAVARYISSLNIGIIDLSLAHSAPIIYPNPIDKRATLEYTLQHDETISIYLLDLQGKTLQAFIEGEKQAAGEHQLSIDLPETLPSGNYLILISSPNGRATVQVTK